MQVEAGPGGDVSGTRFEVCSAGGALAVVGPDAADRVAPGQAVVALVAADLVAAGAPVVAVRAAKVADCRSWATRSRACSAVGADVPGGVREGVLAVAAHVRVGVQVARPVAPGVGVGAASVTRCEACSAVAAGRVLVPAAASEGVHTGVRGAAHPAVHAAGSEAPRDGWVRCWAVLALVRRRPVGVQAYAVVPAVHSAAGLRGGPRLDGCRGGYRLRAGPAARVCGGVRSAVHGPDVSQLPGDAGCWLPVGCCSARFSPGSGNPCRAPTGHGCGGGFEGCTARPAHPAVQVRLHSGC